ncbi:MAG TPA: hypothetical protein VNX17_11165 [Edaphobacter sp.]|jgi:hypothetical protein|nr:hypothetical protein [Edaphobacter sp.]
MAFGNDGITHNRFLRFALVFTTILSLSMMWIRVSSYPSMLRLPGATALLVEVAALLLLYGAVLFWGAGLASPKLLLQGTTIGLIAGLVQIIHLLSEHFVSFSGAWNGAITLAFMLTTFMLWGVTGFIAARSGQATPTGIWLAVWSAVVTMTIVVAAGFALEFFLSPTPPESMLAWPEFKRSGWTDVHAFAIANTLDSAFSHLLISPVVAAIVGKVGSMLGSVLRNSSRSKTAPSDLTS